MQDRVGQFLASLSDPSQYVVVKDVPVFDEHTDVVWVKDNRTVAKGTPGARRVVHKFDRARLERIADNCNARLRRGDAAPLAIGHTDPNNPDERDQPDLVGYAANYKVGYSERHGRHMLYADYHIAREHYPEARKYPRTSVELWPEGEREFLDPISLIKRTPQRDLGQWVYSRQGKLVLRYSMEHSMNDDLNDLGGADAGAGAAAEPSHEEKLEQFAKHCFSHPHAAHFAKHYAMGADAPPGGEPPADMPAPEPPPGDPTEPPDADKPSQFSAAPAFPGGSNAGLPGGKKPAQHARGGSAGESAVVQQLKREIAELRHYNRQSAEAASRAEAKRLVTELEAEGYDLDRDEEVAAFAALGEADRKKRFEYVRRHFRQSPTSPLGRVGLADDPQATRRRDEQGPTHDEHMRAIQYMRVKGGSYEGALEATKKG